MDPASDADFIDEDLPPDLYAIRLQGPWRYEWYAPDDPDAVSKSGTMRLPDPAARFEMRTCTSLRLKRRFHRPTNLDADERVMVLLPGGCRPSSVEVNGQEVEFPKIVGDRPAADVTGQLRESNELVLSFAAPSKEILPCSSPVLLGIMPDVDGWWWNDLPRSDVAD